MGLRFGITMREVTAVNYYEPRDAIARDWSVYMSNAFPEDKWLFIPNIKDQAVHLFKEWNLNVLILTGGDDLGRTPDRDVTELALLRYAFENNIPVIAVCRGMQLVHSYYGGELIKCGEEFEKIHRASSHDIIIHGEHHKVNSYHKGMLKESTLDVRLTILARCKIDNSIEMFYSEKVLAMMWHPEREKEVSEWNLDLIKQFISNGL
jgi:N5-(cytidine 5'-diphosphoramidyl)-L-glutamine hydrolase